MPCWPSCPVWATDRTPQVPIAIDGASSAQTVRPATENPTSQSSRFERKRMLRGGSAVLVVVGLANGTVALATDRSGIFELHAGGDPDGRVLQALTPVAEWKQSVPGTMSARAAVFAHPAGTGPAAGLPGTAWFLGVKGKTPRYALPGC